MPFFMVALLVISIVTSVLSGLLRKIPKVKVSPAGDVQAPTAEEGRNIPVIFGTCLMRAPNVVWYGNFGTSEIKKKKQVIGHKYFVGMDLHLCHGPVDKLVDIRAGAGEDLVHVNYTVSGNSDESSNTGNSDPRPVGSSLLLSKKDVEKTIKIGGLGILGIGNSFIDMERPGGLSIRLNDPGLFGGEEKEGGISGSAGFYPGSLTQGSDPYMTGKIRAAYPAYRGIAHLVLGGPAGVYFGTSPYIKNLGVVLRRCPANLGLSESQSNINGDANPAEIIYEVLRNNAWGLGFPESRFDLSSFKAAAQTLADEGMGMSMQVASPEQADSLIETVLQHIDGVCYTDPATGLWTLKLVRAVDPSTLTEYGPDDIIECEFSRGSWESTVNEIKVKYLDRAKWKESIVQVQETANRATRGEAVVSQIDFLGFSNAAIAQRVATRELRANSYPIASGRIKINRKAWQWRMGTAFLLTWPPLGISRMPVRVVGINYGSLEHGEIEADIVEDVFGVSYTAYAPPPESEWVNPIGEPKPPIAQLATEAPYQVTGSPDRHILCAAVRADEISTSYEVCEYDDGEYYHSNTVNKFCPYCVLDEYYPENTPAFDENGFRLSSPVDLDTVEPATAAEAQRGDNLLVIVNDDGKEEWCAFQAVGINDDEYVAVGITRGIYDTIPIDHPAGAKVYIVRDDGEFNSGLAQDDAYASNQTVQIKMLPRNPRGVAALENVQLVSAELSNRAAKPYPPGRVRVNDDAWPSGKIFEGGVTLTWAHRNRTTQTGAGIVSQDAASVSSGPEGSYKIEVLISGAVKRTVEGITGTSWTYTEEMRQEDKLPATASAAFRITPVNGGLSGTSRTTGQFTVITEQA